ncbi:MAG TPA: VWA domain-containing protein [Chthoniobacteraceae bacterium]|nr:VWA domain-containing protein [Chthoniobacteraceae bacterium]
MSLSFAHPWLLLLLLLLPALALLGGARGQAPAVVYSSIAPLRALGRFRRARAGNVLLGLLLLGLALGIVALARPQLGRTVSRVQASGIDIMLAIDVSRSMLAEDLSIGNERANRLDAVKQVTEKFIESRPNDRIGILCFAGRPYLVSPLTLDHDWLLKNLERVRIGLVEDGTAIGSAIASAANRLKDKEAKSKIIVLLTDGDNNAGKVTPATAAEAAKALGIKVYTVGAGTRGYAPVPVQDRFSGRTFYQNIRVEVDEKTLREIATLTNAQYYRATDGKSLREIFEQIDKMEKSTVELDQYKQYRDLFPWFLGAGFAMIAFQAVLGETLWRRLP